MAQLFEDIPEALRNSVEIAKRCNLKLTLGKSQLPRFPTPNNVGLDEYLRARALEGLERRLRPCIRLRRARGGAPALCRPARIRDQNDPADGIPRLLPDRRGLHQLGEDARCPGRAGQGLGRGIAGRLQPWHHRPRSAALQPALRALSESRARVDAGLRYRFLPGRPRSRHRLRESEIRRGQRLADRDFRNDGRESGRARRGTRARSRLQLLRSAREADPVPAGQAHHAQRRARDGAAVERAGEKRRGSRASCSRSPGSSKVSRAMSACTRAAC